MRFVVCSYNRGAFLRHCVDTIERCAPAHPITVMDDSSDDRETIQALDAIAARHEVISATSLSDHKHGGLYENMQAALKRSDDDLICYLQDDTQLVRPLEARDERDLHAAFEAADNLAFISPCFIRGIALKHRRDRNFRFDPATDLWYWLPEKRSTGAFYSDVAIVHPRRLQQADWQFAEGESANDKQARQLFGRMGHLQAPFAMWLPNVPAFRGKRKTAALRWAEKTKKSGFYGISTLSTQSVDSLRQAPHPPLAEDWLQVTPSYMRHPWTYDPLQGSNLLKWADRAERRILP